MDTSKSVTTDPNTSRLETIIVSKPNNPKTTLRRRLPSVNFKNDVSLSKKAYPRKVPLIRKYTENARAPTRGERIVLRFPRITRQVIKENTVGKNFLSYVIQSGIVVSRNPFFNVCSPSDLLLFCF